ncbi:MAG: phosphotransferase [Marinospirillum sp.]|uniref:aminoglycoside phosphotransferase family protein n=1 Tax=Marinospirillum sp. TaxID=2183934 RepID=UPI001A09E568|nr:phosphotransferase [Marinospirillum sp.]MBE0508895.1 phosphotransferase [Marinospirillum sp.]
MINPVMSHYQTPVITERSKALDAWLKPWLLGSTCSLVTVAGDASFRSYYRLPAAQNTQDKNLILMDAPPEKECSKAFIHLARAWHQRGVQVPELLAYDLDLGVALLQDFGDNQLMRCVDIQHPQVADRFYQQALQQLSQLQQLPADAADDHPLPDYDAALLTRELDLFDDWLLNQLLGITERPASWQAFRAQLVQEALDQPRVTVHRDYHSRNLMLLNNGQLGILDFQDAVFGPCTYDAVSLIRDCYLLWPQPLQQSWLKLAHQLHCETFKPVSFAQYHHWFDWMGMQRHLKAAGIFARLWLRDGKAGYLQDIPRTLTHLIQALDAYPDYQDLRDWLQQDIQTALKSRLQCLRHDQ